MTVVLDDAQLDEEFIRGVIHSTATAYAEMCVDEEAWADELAERAVLDGSLADGANSR